MYKRTTGIPGFSKNAVLQLVVASGVGFVAYHLTRVILLIAGADPTFFAANIAGNVALPSQEGFLSKLWTVFTYSWVHAGFWELFSNMVWLYVFGSVVQMLIGYRQIIPMFLYSTIVGALFYEVAQFFPGDMFLGRMYMVGAQAGIVCFAVAALSLSPNYRYYLTEHFSLPLLVIAIIFFALAIMNANLEGAALLLLIGGATTGFVYVRLLKVGYKPGGWLYNIMDYLNNSVAPKDKKASSANLSLPFKGKLNTTKSAKGINIDDILDKINDKGYDALSKEEKETLLNASKNKD